MGKGLVRKSKGKKRAQIRHAKHRFETRFDTTLNDGEYLNLVKQIQDGEAEFVERQSNRVTVWNVALNEKVVRVIYDKRTKVIVSALPIFGLEKLTSRKERKQICPRYQL